ncbi:MAG: epoxyqueuosine reductase [Clostridia bacterium]|nr:epoxyqueuosine reductase [Clostridia bacterium]
MKEKVEKIISRFTEDFGFCEFEKVAPHLIECANKRKIPESAKTVITVIFPYCLDDELYENLNVSRYAAVPDYHLVAGKYLEKIVIALKEEFADEDFVFFTDNSPISEVATACASGLGVVGRNGLLINDKYGSWVFIGEIVTTLDVGKTSVEIKRCLDCGKCVRECPVSALSEENFGRDICLSNVSQKKGEIPEEYQLLMQKYGCAWGCDICQQVCPMNKGKRKTAIEEFIKGFVSHVDEGVEVEGRAFAWRGEKVIKRNLEIINKKR